MIADLTKLARSLTASEAGPFAFCGIGVTGEQGPAFHTATASGIDADEHSVWRCASISKIVTGRVAHRVLTQSGNLDCTVEDLLGFPFRAPDGTAPTPAQLASHQAGLTDAAGYAVSSGTTLQDWLLDKGASIWSGAEPGAQFEYSNLGFILLAACAERAAGDAFGPLAKREFMTRFGVQASFNWSGHAGQPKVLPTYRRTDEGRFIPQIDGDGAMIPQLPQPYVVGSQPHLFSPQGGLRMSLVNLMALSNCLQDHPTYRGWIADPVRTSGPADLFQSYAWGMQIFEVPSFYPRPLIGHFANAYGFCGGVWWDVERSKGFAYALNGLAIGDEDDGLRAQELSIFDAISQAL